MFEKLCIHVSKETEAVQEVRAQQMGVVMQHLINLPGDTQHSDAVWSFVTNLVLRATCLDSHLIRPENEKTAPLDARLRRTA